MEINKKKILTKEYRANVKKNLDKEKNFRQIFEEMKSNKKKIDKKIIESLKNSLSDTEDELIKIRQTNKNLKDKMDQLSTKYNNIIISPSKENKEEVLFDEEKIPQKKSFITQSQNIFL